MKKNVEGEDRSFSGTIRSARKLLASIEWWIDPKESRNYQSPPFTVEKSTLLPGGLPEDLITRMSWRLYEATAPPMPSSAKGIKGPRETLTQIHAMESLWSSLGDFRK